MSNQPEQKTKKPTPKENQDLLTRWLIYDLQMKDTMYRQALSLDQARLNFGSFRRYVA